MFFTIISLIVLYCSIRLFKLNIGSFSITQLNMMSWIFYYELLAESFVASVLVINNIDNHYAIARAGEAARLYGWLSVQYVMIALPLGMLMCNTVFKRNSVKVAFENFLNEKLQPSLSKKDTYIRFILYLLSGISLLAVIYTFSQLKSIPLLAVLKGKSSVILAGLRQDSARNFAGNQYIRNLFAITLTPILCYISYAYYMMTKSKKDLVWFLCLFISSFFILTYDISKGPFISFIIGFVICRVLIVGKISKKTIIITAICCLLLLVVAYATVMKVVDFKTLFAYNSGIVGRILLSQSGGTYLSFQYFPERHDFLGFSSLSRYVSEFFGISYNERSARLLMKIFNPEAIEQGIAGVINSLFVAEAWCNWGVVGVILSPLYVGFVIMLVFRFFVTSRKTPLMVGFFSYLSLKMPITGGVNDFIYNAGLATVFFIFIIIYILAIMLKEFRRLGTNENDISSSTAIRL